MFRRLNHARPDVLWVGMTAPKQEMWIHRVGPQLEVKFAAAIGAVFDFYTGRVKRSSPVFQRLGLEVAPAASPEPRRLWRRMFVSAPIFVRDAILKRGGMLDASDLHRRQPARIKWRVPAVCTGLMSEA